MSEFHKVNGSGPRDIVVMKFGGTSVEDAAAIRRMTHIVASKLYSHPVVVVSALAKVTDQLLATAEAAAQGNMEYSVAAVAALGVRHRQVASDLLKLHADEFSRYLDPALDDLQGALCAVAAAGRLEPAAQDKILSVGEHLSSRLAAAALREAKISAVHADAASLVVTDSRHTQSTPFWDVTGDRLSQALLPLIDSNQVPVLGGFIASTRDGVPTTLGRGGSDLSAALVGAALRSRLIEIWTDVDGIMTSDPNICPDARLISRMSFDEAAELAHFGAKVLHPATLLPAMRQNIPVHVLNSRSLAAEGTQIVARVPGGNGVRAVTAKRGVAAVEIDLSEKDRPDALALVWHAFDRHHCPVDLMAVARGRLSLVVGSTKALPAVAADLRGIANLTWENHKALVCLIGENVRRLPDVASRLFAAVSDLDVRVICQGGSDRSLAFLVEESNAEDSVRRLHAVFFSDRKPSLSAKLSHAALCQAGEAWL